MKDEVLGYVLLGGAAICFGAWLRDWVGGTSAHDFDVLEHRDGSDEYQANQAYFLTMGIILLVAAVWILLGGEI